MGIMIVPLVFATGFGIDYGRAQQAQTKLNAIADSAALVAVSPNIMGNTDSDSKVAATTYFNGQAATIPNITVSAPAITVNTDPAGVRTATVTYTAASKNLFSTILGKATLAIGGTSSAVASQAPSINFYVALDTSPSMLLPTTSNGITNLNAGARWNGEYSYYSRVDGCDFACHSNNMQQWNMGTYVVDSSKNAVYLNNNSSSPISFFRVACNGNVYDNNNNLIGSSGSIQNSETYCTSASSIRYGPAANPVTLQYKPSGAYNYTTVSVNFPDTWWLARNYSTVNPGQPQITLRTDAEGDAAAGVIQYAWQVQDAQSRTSSSASTYKMQFFTFNVGTPAPLSTAPFGTMTNVKDLITVNFPDLGAQAPLLYANSYWTTSSQKTNNADTDFNALLSGMAAVLPTKAGTGTATSPQSVLIIITDGLSDNATDGVTPLTSANITQCTNIKKYTRIAILYTQYLPATINYTGSSNFNSIAANKVPNIQAQLQACASQNTDGSYLMQTVTTDGDLTTALNKLFAMTVQTAHLVK